jgi:hypothetical protein
MEGPELELVMDSDGQSCLWAMGPGNLLSMKTRVGKGMSCDTNNFRLFQKRAMLKLFKKAGGQTREYTPRSYRLLTSLMCRCAPDDECQLQVRAWFVGGVLHFEARSGFSANVSARCGFSQAQIVWRARLHRTDQP